MTKVAIEVAQRTRESIRPWGALRKGVLHLVLAALGVLMAFPFVWMVLNALMTQKEVSSLPLKWWPAEPQWQNFIDVWSAAPFSLYMFNSFFTAASIVALVLTNSALLAYALTQFQFRGRNLLFSVILATYMLPSPVTYVPSFVIVSRLGWIDTYQGIIFSNAVNVFAVFLVRQAFLQVPRELKEAALVDGASHWRILTRIYVPLCKETFIALGLLVFLQMYNNYLWPMLITKSKEMRLITIGLRQFFIEQGAYGVNWPMILTASTIAIVPLLILFFVAQEWFVKGVRDSGVKG